MRQEKTNKKAVTSLATVWYEWYTREPRIWMCEASRQQVSNSRKTVAYMKLFLEEGYNLDEKAEKFKELVMKFENLAETRLYKFLRQRGIASNKSGSVF